MDVGSVTVGDPPRVSVIVPHYGDLPSLRACLESLERQTYPRELFEIIVADNASPEGEAAVTEAIGGRARLVVVGERGAGPARNGGVAEATGDTLAFIDCDCVAEPHWLEEGVRALASYDLVGGRMKVLVVDPAVMSAAEAFERVFAFDNETYVRRKGFSVTANLFCGKDMFQRVGGFRRHVSEDYDWCQRAVAAGYRLGYAERAVVGHPARRTWAELQRKWRRLHREAFALRASRPGGRARWALRILAMPLSAVAHTPKVIFSRELAGARQRIKAIWMLFRVRLWRLWDGLRLAVSKDLS